MRPDIPWLKTTRLGLRAMTANDWPNYLALMSSDRARHMGGPFSRAVAWGLFCSDHASWDFHKVGALMIDRTSDGRTIGQVAVNAGPLFPEFELGWMLYPDAEGQGLAFEAAVAMRDWAKGPRGLPELVSYVDPRNIRSRRLAERLGARLDSLASPQDPGDLVYRHF